MLAGVRPAKRGESRPLTWCAKRRRPWSEHLSDEEAEDADAEETCAEQVVCEETNRPMHRSDCAQLTWREAATKKFRFFCQDRCCGWLSIGRSNRAETADPSGEPSLRGRSDSFDCKTGPGQMTRRNSSFGTCRTFGIPIPGLQCNAAGVNASAPKRLASCTEKKVGHNSHRRTLFVTRPNSKSKGQKMKEPTGLKERVAFDSSAPNDLKLISHFASLLAVSRLTVG
eukprot:g29987.t1